MPQLLRVQNFMLSMDGFGAGEGQSLEEPFGHAESRGGRAPRLPIDLASWAFATASWANRTEPGGSRGLDDYFTRDFAHNIGAEIMGRNKFGPQRGPWTDENWKGWWGDNPPYHVPVFVLTHHGRDPVEMEGGTTFYFVTGGIREALGRAREAAGGKDVRVGGGPGTIRQYLREGLIDEMHIAISPVLLGRGEALFEGVDMRSMGYECVEFEKSEKATHVVLRRGGVTK